MCRFNETAMKDYVFYSTYNTPTYSLERVFPLLHYYFFSVNKKCQFQSFDYNKKKCTELYKTLAFHCTTNLLHIPKCIIFKFICVNNIFPSFASIILLPTIPFSLYLFFYAVCEVVL